MEWLPVSLRPSPPVLLRIALALTPVALVLGGWTITAVLVRHLHGSPFPGPLETAARGAAVLAGDELLGHSVYLHAGASLARWVVGFILGALIGVAIAIGAGWCWWAERALMPLVYVLQLVPGLAWIPIAILLFGLGNTATVFMIVVTAVAPVAVNMVAGIRTAHVEHLRVAQMAGAGPGQIFWRVLLPGAVPHVLSGLRLALGNSWRVVVAAEMVVGSGSGLGYCIIQSRWTLDYTSSFVCIGVICLVGLLVEYVVFSRLEALTVRRWGMVRPS